jgi:hypothetical protein
VTFGSNGYEQTVFQLTSSAGIKVVHVTVSFEQVTGG